MLKILASRNYGIEWITNWNSNNIFNGSFRVKIDGYSEIDDILCPRISYYFSRGFETLSKTDNRFVSLSTVAKILKHLIDNNVSLNYPIGCNFPNKIVQFVSPLWISRLYLCNLQKEKKEKTCTFAWKWRNEVGAELKWFIAREQHHVILPH